MPQWKTEMFQENGYIAVNIFKEKAIEMKTLCLELTVYFQYDLPTKKVLS